MKKTCALLLAGLLALGSLAGCTPASNPGGTITLERQTLGNSTALQRPVLQEAQALLEPDYATEGSQNSVSANAFAFKLTSVLLEKEKNSIFSPFSIWMSLAALTNAANDAAMPALLEALGLAGATAEEINQAVSQMLYTFTNADGYVEHNPLAIANAVFVGKDMQLQAVFAQRFLDYYRGESLYVDFTSPEAADAVNAWAEEHTNGLIREVVQEFDPQTLAAIANAIYFSDRWSWEFDPAETQEMPFYGVSSEVTAPFMLREGMTPRYYEDETLQAMPLAFQSGGALYILLPKDGDANALLSGMDEATFRQIAEGAQAHTGKLLLPKFSLDSEYALKDALEVLGVPLFDAESTPLDGLLNGKQAFITEAMHKATIEVDEKGTTAAAVTVIAMAGSGMLLPTDAPFEMVCDRPFAFLLTRAVPGAGEQVLFCGVVNQL